MRIAIAVSRRPTIGCNGFFSPKGRIFQAILTEYLASSKEHKIDIFWIVHPLNFGAAQFERLKNPPFNQVVRVRRTDAEVENSGAQDDAVAPEITG